MEGINQRPPLSRIGRNALSGCVSMANHALDDHCHRGQARAQRTENHADQRGTHDRPQAGTIDTPILGERGRDQAHGSGIQTIQENDQKTQNNRTPLVARKGLRIDEGLHIKAVSN